MNQEKYIGMDVHQAKIPPRAPDLLLRADESSH